MPPPIFNHRFAGLESARDFVCHAFRALSAVCLAALAFLLSAGGSARADSTTGVISEAEVVSFVKNTWGWTSFADNVIITKLDGAYDGIPFRDYIKGVIVGLELH